jgi:hypothetical protein
LRERWRRSEDRKDLDSRQRRPFPKEDAAKFMGVDVPTIEYLIRTMKLEYVQDGSQRVRVIPVSSLRKFLADYPESTGEDLRRKRKRG